MILLSLFPLLASLPTKQTWYLLPLIVAVSLVYGATRHELFGPILQHTLRTAGWLVGFMGVLIFAAWLLSYWV